MECYESPSIEPVGGGVEPLATLALALYLLYYGAVVAFAVAAISVAVVLPWEILIPDT